MPIGVDTAIKRARELTKQELFILRTSPYDSTGTHWNAPHATRRLCKHGLLQENPTVKHCYRITDDGAEVLFAYFAMKNAGTLKGCTAQRAFR